MADDREVDSTRLPSSNHAKLSILSHRLPTVSASQALQSLQTPEHRPLTTGLPTLDQALSNNGLAFPGGFARGKVSEIWGPSGSGKTTVLFQTACEVIKDGGTVIWMDGSTPLNALKKNYLKAIKSETAPASTSYNLCHYSLSTLSHVLALVLHPPDWFLPSGTSLLVIDGLDSLIDLDYPRLPWTVGAKTDQQKWQAGRRYGILGTLVSSLNKLAVLHNVAVLVSTGYSTRGRSEQVRVAAIAPGIGSSEWESGIWNRIVIMRDFHSRFVCVQKCQGRNITPLDPVGEVQNVIAVEIDATGRLKQTRIQSRPDDTITKTAQESVAATNSFQPARKRLYEEIADSDEEEADEYGWVELDGDALATEELLEDQAPRDGSEES